MITSRRRPKRDDWLLEVVSYLESNRALLMDLILQEIPGAQMVEPEATYSGWIDFSHTGVGERPAEFFARHASVALTEGVMCGEVGAGFARLVFATPRPILERIVHALGKSVRAASGR